MQKNKILVTGGAGFVGSHLCKELLKKDNYVICVDNFFTGSKSNIINLLSDSNFELIRHDITLPLIIEVDQIYNLACPASPIHYQFDPVQTIKPVHGSINMLGLQKEQGLKFYRLLLLKSMGILKYTHKRIICWISKPNRSKSLL